MPPRQLPPNFSQAYYSVSRDKLSAIGDSLAQQAGEPASIEVMPATDRMRAKAWNQKHPAATPEMLWNLAQQKYQEHRQRGLPDADARKATAEDLTHATYRARMPLYTAGTTDWKQQVQEATRLSRLSKRHADEAAADEAASDPFPKPPNPLRAPDEEGMSDEY